MCLFEAHSRHMVQATLKPGVATTRTARGEGGRHRAEGWHVRRGAEQPAQKREHYQRGLAHEGPILVP